MIRTKVGKPFERDQFEVIGVKDVIERPSEQRIIGVEGIVHAATDARVEEATDFLEELCCMGP